MKSYTKFLIIACQLLLAGCSNALFDALGDFAEYSVTYKENGSETGTVPDSAGYERGMIVSVPGNTGDLEKNDFTFTGWNIQASGNGTNYAQGELFIMKPADLTLYVRWSANIAIVSMAADGTPGDDSSTDASISSDGRYIAFVSWASTLDPWETNIHSDIFVYDRDADGNGIFETGAGKTAITMVTIDSNGEETDGDSYTPSISSDGRYIAFQSSAKDLVPGDANGKGDIFLHDRDADGNEIFDETGTGKTSITRISVEPDGITGGDDDSYSPSISGDGRYVAFESDATNLVTGDTEGYTDIFVYDRQTGITKRVSVASDGTAADDGDSSDPSISGDGRYVAFKSLASNLVAVDSNGIISDVFAHDCITGTTALISVASDGTQGIGSSSAPSISNDGIYIAFKSDAANLVAGDMNTSIDVFVHNRQTGITTRVSIASDGTEGNDYSSQPSVSGDGRYVTFGSKATNLVAGDTKGLDDIFVHDRVTGSTARVSIDKNRTEAEDFSVTPSISSNGRYIAFGSPAANLVAGDENNRSDIFVAPVR